MSAPSSGTLSSTSMSTEAVDAAVVTVAVSAEAPAVPIMVREIHKNGWLKKLPASDRRIPPFVKPPKPEKMWVVFCIHDDVDAFLEFYENRRSAFSHHPLSSVPMLHCLHISPNIVVHDSDFVFSITMESPLAIGGHAHGHQVVRLAAASRDQMTEWIETLKAKLTELGVLQPRYNVYSRGPEAKPSLAPVRDPTSPLPPPPGSAGSSSTLPSRRPTPPPRSAVSLQSVAPGPVNAVSGSTSGSRIRSSLSLQLIGGNNAQPSSRPSQPVTPTSPPSTSPVSGPVSYTRHHLPLTPPASATSLRDDSGSERRSPSSTSHSATHFPFDVTMGNGEAGTSTINASRPAPSPTSPRSFASGGSTSLPSSPLTNAGYSSTLPTPIWSPVLDSVYEPICLPCSPSADRVILGGIRNPNYFSSLRPSPPTPGIAASTRNSATFERFPSAVGYRGNPDGNSLGGSVGRPPQLPAVARMDGSSNYEHAFLCAAATTQSEEGDEENDGQPFLPPPPPPPTATSSSVDGSNGERSWVDENHRPITLRQKQVLHLSREMNHLAGIRLHLQRKDCVNTIALVDYLGAVWIAGWKQREHPYLYHSFHIGDRIISIGGRSVRSQSEAHRIIKNEMLPKIEFIIARLPFGKVFAIKRDLEGQPLGLIREGNTAEIVIVEPDGLAARHGLPPHSQSCEGDGVCNWVLTEVNGRPLNLFFKDNEIQDRLKAVGKDISILVQPSTFVKALKKQLKTMWGYKDYIVQ